MNREGEENERGFVVIDRRGEDEDESAGDEGRQEAPTSDPPPRPEDLQGEASGDERIGEIDFSTLVHSFAISALYNMGAAPPTGAPGEELPEINLAVAKQNIDILEVLQQKTAGNLNDEEQALLDGVLYEVRMRFVEASKGA